MCSIKTPGSGALALVACSLMFCGCVSKPEAQTPREIPLKAGDCIIVNTIHQEAPEEHHVIDSAGNISLPLLGSYHVAGYTLKQAETQLERAYVEGGFYVRIDLVVLLH